MHLSSVRLVLHLLLWATWSEEILSFHLPHTRSSSSTTRAKPISTLLHFSHNNSDQVFTTALLRISYDGRHFTGWSAANDRYRRVATNKTNNRHNIDDLESPQQLEQRRRRRSQRNSNNQHLPDGYVRSVQGEIQRCLSKVYGNVDIQRVVVEGCSRTDRGVHATSMVAQVYCRRLGTGRGDDDGSDSKEVEEVVFHPRNATDPNFVPIPMPLPKLAYSLNRMLPADVRVVAIAAVPPPPSPLVAATTTATNSTAGRRHESFHPTLSSTSKTYRYRFSAGGPSSIQDPLQRRQVWHVIVAGSRTNNDTHNYLDFGAMQQACRVLQGRHDFVAFQGAPRGSEPRNLNTVCTLYSICLTSSKSVDPWNHEGSCNQFELYVSGDRFVYKMVRFLTGAIVAVGLGELKVEHLQQVLFTGKRYSGATNTNHVHLECAPPHGLTLVRVEYDAKIEWQ